MVEVVILTQGPFPLFVLTVEVSVAPAHLPVLPILDLSVYPLPFVDSVSSDFSFFFSPPSFVVTHRPGCPCSVFVYKFKFDPSHVLILYSNLPGPSCVGVYRNGFFRVLDSARSCLLSFRKLCPVCVTFHTPSPRVSLDSLLSTLTRFLVPWGPERDVSLPECDVATVTTLSVPVLVHGTKDFRVRFPTQTTSLSL